MNKHFIIMAAAATILTSCTFDIPEQAAPQWSKTHTFEAFLNTYMTDLGSYQPVRTRSFVTEAANATESDNYGLFSIDSIPAGGADIVICGRVVSDDYAGNMYKTMVIQDIEHPERGLRISVDAGNLSGIYPLGQLINIRCNGLAVGKYAFQPQLCLPAYNNNVNAQNYLSKIGWAPGRISFPRFLQAVETIGLPEPDKIVENVMDIASIKSVTAGIEGTSTGTNNKAGLYSANAQIQALNGRLVRFNNVHFTGEYDYNGTATVCTEGNPELVSEAACFAPTTKNVGYPQGRYIADASGNKILISTSEYAKFANYKLPSSEYVGTVIGVLGFYYDRAKYGLDGGEWGITIRSLDDVQLTSTIDGSSWTPKEWTAE